MTQKITVKSVTLIRMTMKKYFWNNEKYFGKSITIFRIEVFSLKTFTTFLFRQFTSDDENSSYTNV